MINFLKIFLFIVSICNFSTNLNAQESKPSYLADDGWNLGIALGIGVVDNPLVDSSNIPLPFIPKFELYKGDFSLVNTSFNYSLYQSDSSRFSMLGQLNKDGIYFIDELKQASFTSAITVNTPASKPMGGNVSSEQGFTPPKRDGKIKNISKRDLSYMAGVEFLHDWQDWRLVTSWFQDVTGVHEGQESFVRLEKIWSGSKQVVLLSFELQHQSKELVQYYYGTTYVDSSDGYFGYYRATDSINKSINIKYQLKFTPNLRFVTDIQMQELGRGIADSSLVSKTHLTSFFLGLAWSY